MTTARKKTTAPRPTAADMAALERDVAELKQGIEQATERTAEAERRADAATAELEAASGQFEAANAELTQLGLFLEDSYPDERRSGETAVDTVVRLLDRARAVAPSGVDPSSGLPLNTTAAAGDGPVLRDVTLGVDDVPPGATLDDVAGELGVDPTTLLAYNAPVLDAEAQARGLPHSDNGRHLFAGTVLRVPAQGG